MAVTKQAGDNTKPVVIQNFVVARPPQRTQFDTGDWRVSIDSSESMYNPNRVLLYDIYDDVLLDPHLKRQWEKRIENITTTDWIFVVDGKEQDVINALIDTPVFEDILTEIMGRKSHGRALLELGTKAITLMGDELLELTLYSVEKKHIRLEEGVIVKEQYDTAESATKINYREGIYPLYVAELGTPKDKGILLEIVPYVLLKKGAISDWALFVQLFGQPFREYTYDGYDETIRQKLEKAAQEMASAPYIIMPDGAKFTLHDIKNNNTGQVHQGFVDYCDQQISIRILGNTETTKSSNSSGYAQSQTHAQTEDAVYTADKQMVRRILNNKIRPILYNLGYPVKGGFFVPRETKNLDDVMKRLNVLKAVKALGAPVQDDTIYEDADVPKPDNYDSLKAEMAAQAEADNGNDNPPGRPVGRPVPKNKKKVTLSDAKWIRSFRLFMADFFDPAP